MKELHGRAATGVTAAPDRCMALLRAVDGYPAWYPQVVREVEVVERVDGEPAVVRATLRVAVARFAQDVHLLLRVSGDDATVTLTRVAHDPSDQEELIVSWQVGSGEGPGDSRITVELSARLDVPRLVPLGGLGDSMARGFVMAAAQAMEA